MNKGKFEQAEPVLRDVIALKPNDHRAHYDLGNTLMVLQRYHGAIHAMKDSISLSPYGDIYPDAIFRIGQCLAHLHQWDDARKHFDRVLAIEHWRKEPIYSRTFPHLHTVELARKEAFDQATRLGQFTAEPLLPSNQEAPDSLEISAQTDQPRPEQQLVSSSLPRSRCHHWPRFLSGLVLSHYSSRGC